MIANLNIAEAATVLSGHGSVKYVWCSLVVTRLQKLQLSDTFRRNLVSLVCSKVCEAPWPPCMGHAM